MCKRECKGTCKIKPKHIKPRTKKKVKVGKVDKVTTLPGKDFATKQKIEEFYGKDKGFLAPVFEMRYKVTLNGIIKARWEG